jgi:hypothetical protein
MLATALLSETSAWTVTAWQEAWMIALATASASADFER